MKLLTVEDVAQKLGVTDGRVRQLLLSGELKGQKHGERVWVIAPADLEDYVKARRQKKRDHKM